MPLKSKTISVRANLCRRIEVLRKLFKTFHEKERSFRTKASEEAAPKKKKRGSDSLAKTEFEEVQVVRRPARSAGRRKSALHWKQEHKMESPSARRGGMTPKKEDKMTIKEETKVAGDVKDLSVEDVVQSKDFWIALKILDEVSKVKMLEKLLNEEDTAVVRRLFEENLAKPSYKEIKLFHRAMNKLWEEVMCNLGQFHFEHEAHVLLCEREKAKSRFLDVMLICPSTLPQSWGGQHICHLTESEAGSLLVPVMAVDEIALLHPTLSERTEENKEQMVKPEKSSFKAEKGLEKRKGHVDIAASLAEGEAKDYDNVDSKDLNEYLSQLGRTEEGLEKQKASTTIKRSTATEAPAEPSKKGQHEKRLEKEISGRRLLPLKDLARTQEDLSPTQTPLLREKERGEGESKKYSKEEGVKVVRRKLMKEKAMPAEPKPDHSTKVSRTPQESPKLQKEAKTSIIPKEHVLSKAKQEVIKLVSTTQSEKKQEQIKTTQEKPKEDGLCKVEKVAATVPTAQEITKKTVECPTKDGLGKKIKEIVASVPKTPKESTKIQEEEKLLLKPEKDELSKRKKEESTTAPGERETSTKRKESLHAKEMPMQDELGKKKKKLILAAVSRTPLETPKVQREAKPTVKPKDHELDKPVKQEIMTASKTPKEGEERRGEIKLIEEKPKEDELCKPKKEEVLNAVSSTLQDTTRKRTEERIEDKKNELNKEKEEPVQAVPQTPQKSAKIQREERPAKPKKIEPSKQKEEVSKAASDKQAESTKKRREEKECTEPKVEKKDDKQIGELKAIFDERQKIEKHRSKEALVKEKTKLDDLSVPKKEKIPMATSRTPQQRLAERFTVNLKEYGLKKEQSPKSIPKVVDERKEILPEKAQDEEANLKKTNEPPVAAEKFVKVEEKEELEKQILSEMLQKTQEDDTGNFPKVAEGDRKPKELKKKEKVGKSCDNEKFENAKKGSEREHKKGEKSTASDEAHAKLEKEKKRTHGKMEKTKTLSKVRKFFSDNVE
ncbi:unnamed protein product [Cylicocyclus nassatus]|uniref:DUF7774 domain-containing protein n=1 Tax=Cylicocyclus nassatus TaxID=53992 RepID=A0AA36H906_CYLNA|nr:unnamed protein product [Cylicocyclus nassatus]